MSLEFRAREQLEINFWELSMSRWHSKPRDFEIFEEFTVDRKEKSKTWVLEQSSVYDWGGIEKISKTVRRASQWDRKGIGGAGYLPWRAGEADMSRRREELTVLLVADRESKVRLRILQKQSHWWPWKELCQWSGGGESPVGKVQKTMKRKNHSEWVQTMLWRPLILGGREKLSSR